MLTLTIILTLTLTLILTLTVTLTLLLILTNRNRNLTLNCYSAFPMAPSKLHSSPNSPYGEHLFRRPFVLGNFLSQVWFYRLVYIYNVICRWAVWLRRNKWSRWAAWRLLLGAWDGSGQYHVQTTSKAAVYMDLSWWQHPESDRLHLTCAKMENKLDELLHVSRSRLRHKSSIARGDCESQTG